MDPEEQAAKYAWDARHYLWLGNQIVRLGQMGSLVHDMQVKREELRRTVPWQYIKDAMKNGVGVNAKGIFHHETRIMEGAISGKEERYLAVKRAEEARQLAAKREEEQKRKRESE